MMKDKLYKYNHKTFYYVARKTLFVTAVFFGLSVAVGVPTTLNFLTTAPTKGLAETNEPSEVVEQEEESNLEEYISYQED